MMAEIPKAASYLAQLSDMDLLRAAAEARVTALEHAADYAIHELGVPQDELTPAPVANAYRVLVAALAAPTKEGTAVVTDHADTIREALKDYRSRLMDTFYPEDGDLFPDEADRALAALDALVAERDEARQMCDDAVNHLRVRAEAAEARVSKLESANRVLEEELQRERRRKTGGW